MVEFYQTGGADWGLLDIRANRGLEATLNLPKTDFPMRADLAHSASPRGSRSWEQERQ